MPVVAYADVGKAVADLFKGSAKSGAFNLDNKVTYQGATSSGLNVTLTAVTKGDKVEPTLKAAYGKGNYSADISVDGSGSKAALNFGVANVLPGLKLTGSVALPDPNSGKASVEYTGLAQLSTKATVTLTSSPVVEVVASTGVKDVILGVEAGYDTAKSAVRWGPGERSTLGRKSVIRGATTCARRACTRQQRGPGQQGEQRSGCGSRRELSERGGAARTGLLGGDADWTSVHQQPRIDVVDHAGEQVQLRHWIPRA